VIILLSAPAGTLAERLAARTGNPYGKAPGDMARVLADLSAVEPRLRRAASHEIRTTIPLADVVAQVLHLAGAPRVTAPDPAPALRRPSWGSRRAG